MNVLFFTNTPAHAHLYRNAVHRLRERGHDVCVLARDYTCTLDLLEYHDVAYQCFGYLGTSKRSLAANLPKHYVNALRLVRRFDPDLVFGMGGYAAHTGALTGTPSVLVLDSEPTRVDHAISRPFARTILTPNTFRKDLGERHHVFQGLKECAYLHPDVYEPDSSVREELEVGSDEPYAIVRLNAFGSQHDVGKQGITGDDRRRVIEHLADHATVLVSDEGGDADLEGLPADPFDLHPARLHDALAEADLLVADTQTMVTEAAILGTPAIRSNSWVGDDDMGNFLELESRGLIDNVTTTEEITARATTLLTDDGVADTWQRRRESFLAETVNLTDVLVDVALARGRVDDLESVSQYGQAVRQDSPSSVGIGGD
ncbi:DUF354 domain-containing protein [Natrarchaeobaculum aegyptiacum]|uniref:DUF354 domain-containing protein n=1 Tax=Natrarchaeobaculum aegyptiacum TaxID=745377 RepID=A0A2Z2HSP0_9EURY|nr:DUF354 domain-containing protein [Natrarchaeobaculum aegyptiacum]ARS90226.1 hypothetical protein B1756_11150 [Natrarchaeobaculum aegyptiacum]